MWSSDIHLRRVCAAATDSRTSNVRFIQDQLRLLHSSMLESSERIIDIIASIPGTTEAEARLEFCFAISTVKEHYDAIHFDRSIANEYNIARGESNTERRVGYGTVVVRPTHHTRFYSIMCAVSCAIAAGNTFVVECTSHAVDAVLPNLFERLDWEIYGLVQGPVTSLEVLSQCLLIDQSGETEHCNSVTSGASMPSVAVVDRTANVENAAKDVLNTHVAFSGESPHAPKFIMVNEWVKKKFIDEIQYQAKNYFQGASPSHIKSPGWNEAVAEAEAKGEVTVIRSGPVGMIDVHERSSRLLAQATARRCLILITVTSLADTVLACSTIPRYLTGYYFAELEACKFLSQYINSDWSFINHIPIQLLVGPALPYNLKSSAFSLPLRYTKEMLSRPRPELVLSVNGPSSIVLGDLNSPSESSPKLQLLQKKSFQPLSETGQGPGTSIGFFEQGIIVGALFIALPFISAIGYSGWFIMRRVIFPNLAGTA